jgi:hypothetical protein
MSGRSSFDGRTTARRRRWRLRSLPPQQRRRSDDDARGRRRREKEKSLNERVASVVIHVDADLNNKNSVLQKR